MNKGLSIEITFYDKDKNIEQKCVFPINRALPAILSVLKDKLRNQLSHVTNIKVHIKGTYITVIYSFIPVNISDVVKPGLTTLIIKIIEEKVIDKRRHIIIELP